MIIQFANNINQAEPARRVSEDAPKTAPVLKAETKQPSSEQVKGAAENISRAMKQVNQNLEFEFTMDTDTNKTIVKVVDRQTGELVRQMPSEETVAIARSIDRFQRSLLLNQKA